MSTPDPAEAPRPDSRLARARDRARHAGDWASDWASERLPGGALAGEALERERLAAAGLIAGGLAYRLFFWLVPLGLVLASLLSFWVDEDRVGLQDAARNFGISGAATQSAMRAIAEQHHARWYLLLAGLALLVWFGIGVMRALNVAHSIAWKLRPERLRRPVFAGFAFSGVVISLIAVSASTQFLREEYGVTGLWVTIALVGFYLAAVLWIMDKLPHRSTSWRDLLPGAVLVALGTEVIHIVVVLYLVPKLGHSSELYGALGSATVILLWLYLLARLLVAAAFLNAALWDQRTDGRADPPDRVRGSA
jgi:membrane protein